MAELTFLQFIVALLMGLGALCVFIWAALGLFTTSRNQIPRVPRRGERR
jgi:hypothetical protein